MFGKTKPMPGRDERDVDKFIVRTVASNDGAVSDLLNDAAGKGWTIVSIHPLAVAEFSSVQVVFTR
jgi:hypothetical protein